MRIGRNNPCPCGSGRKYKQCCLRLEREAGTMGAAGAAGAALRAAASGEKAWLMDVLPMPVAFDDDPDARPAALLVVAGGLVLHSEILRRPSAEADELADEMARQLEQVVERFEVRPQALIVRDAALVRSLGARLTLDSIAVEEGSLDDLETAAFALREHLAGPGRSRPFASSTRTWGGWGLPGAECAKLFRAAAQFFRALPWRYLWDSEYLSVTAPSGQRWFAAVMGRGGQEFGLALYADRVELESIFKPGGPRGPDSFKAPVLSLLFEEGSTVSREMRKEISRAGWEVAAPAAYPTLIAINTRAGGITRRQVADLEATLRAVAAFTEAYGVDLNAGRAVPAFAHTESGTSLLSEFHIEPESDLPPLGRLEPGGAEGPEARPEAALETEAIYDDPDAFLERESTRVERYAQALEEEGLKPRTVAKHRGNAELFLEFLVMHQGVPLAAMHEYDLRTFLYDWFPRKVMTSRTDALALRGSLRRFFRYLASAEGLRLPASKALLAEKKTFEDRWESFPGGSWWDDDVQRWRVAAELDLYRRLMIHDDVLAREDEWGATMGQVEARLEGELQRRWLLWRDQLLRDGTTDNDELRQQLIARQEAWETEPHRSLSGKTPATAIAAERRATERSLNR